MSDIYKILNNADPERAIPEKMEKVNLSQTEQENIFRYVTSKDNPAKQNKSRYWFKNTAAAAAIICCIGVASVSVTAAINYYVNGNTNRNYRDTVQKEAEVKTVESDGIFSAEDIKVELLEVSRVDDDYRITCRVTFPETADLTELKAECEQVSAEGNDLILGVDAIKENILIDGRSLDEKISSGAETGNFSLGYALCTHIDFEKNVMVQKIDLKFDGDYIEENGGAHMLTVRYQDFVLSDQIVKGEWNCYYEMSENSYEQDTPVTVAMNLSGETLEGDLFTLKAYAVTPNGITLYGTQKLHEPTEDEYQYPCSVATGRILAYDDLGNYYLMYPRIFDYDVNSDRVQQCVYNIYDGAFATINADREYLTEWDSDAAQITVALQQVIDSWDENGQYTGAEYELISEEFTIPLK